MIWIVLALGILVLPLQWVGAAVLAAAIHEAFHYLAVRLCGGEIMGFTVGISGAKLAVRGLSNGQEIFCALAGPMGGLLLLLGLRWIPRTALCAAFQSVFNLFPVYPLDGGRALRCGLEWWLPPERVDGVMLWLGRCAMVGVALLGLYATVCMGLGLMPMLLSAVFCGKIACKPLRH